MSVNKKIHYYKKHYQELKSLTPQLDNCFLYREFAQRVFHAENKIHEIPKNKYGWYYKFISCNKGYCTTELQDLNDAERFKMLSEVEQIAYIKSKKDCKATTVSSCLSSLTSFLTPYCPSSALRVFYIQNDLKEPILDSNKTLINFSANRRKRDLYIPLYKHWTKCYTYNDKLDFIRKEWLLTNKKTRFQRTSVLGNLHTIKEFLESCVPKQVANKCTSLLQLAYTAIYYPKGFVKCPVCNKLITKFNNGKMCYPVTCSLTCNNKHRVNIEKRLANNKTNITGFKTNIGKNENNIITSIASNLKIKNITQNARLGSYYPDAIDFKTKTIIEVNESHHALTRILKKDLLKYEFYRKQGYKLHLVLDNWTYTSKKQKETLKVYNTLKGDVDIIFHVSAHPDYKILSHSGFINFACAKKTGNSTNNICISLNNKSNITVTPEHIFYVNGKEVPARNLKHGDFILTENGTFNAIKNIHTIDKNRDVYDVLNTETGYFFGNGIHVHNCIDEAAFIDQNFMEEFWKSVIPIISSGKKTKIFMVSTPNGTGNKFYEIYSGAEKGTNGWKAERIDWWDVPGRGEKWRKQMANTLGSDEAFQQEFGNTFLDPYNSAVGASVIERFKEKKKKPIWDAEENHYKVYEAPDPNKLYVIGVDVGEGIGRAATVAQVLDITDLKEIKQVAVFGTNIIEPYHYSNKLVLLANQWGNPPLLVERNNCGGQIIDNLFHKHFYEKIVSCSKLANTGSFSNTRHLGILSHNNLRFAGVANMRYWVNFLQVVYINDTDTIQELETFIRYPNGTYRKKNDNFYDDRVMALVWGLFALEPDICQQYFQVDEFDEQNKPLKLSKMYYDEVIPGQFVLGELNTTGNVTNIGGEVTEKYQPLMSDVDMNRALDKEDYWDLLNNGWTTLHNS